MAWSLVNEPRCKGDFSGSKLQVIICEALIICLSISGIRISVAVMVLFPALAAVGVLPNELYQGDNMLQRPFCYLTSAAIL